MEGIMITGSAGAGKSTLGKLVAEKLGYKYIDIDDYLWRKDTDIPFSKMHSREEKIKGLKEAISDGKNFVMAGSMNSFHEEFDPYFKLVVLLTCDKDIRTERINKREYELFGDRILEGGDMYAVHTNFINDIREYDNDNPHNSLKQHNAWLSMLDCKILRLDGSIDLEENAKTIVDTYNDL